MEAIIMAAGIGSRLAEFSRGGPKCLVPVAGVPIIQRQLEALFAVGVSRVIVVTGFAAECVERAVADRRVEFVHNARFRETNVLTSWAIGSAALCHDHFYLHGDTVFEPELLRRLLAKRSSGVVMSVDRHPCADEEMKVEVDGEHVVAVSKELPLDRTLGEFTGVMWVEQRLLDPLRHAASELLREPGSERFFFERAVERIIARQPEDVVWVDITGLRWREVDFPEDLAAAESLFSEA